MATSSDSAPKREAKCGCCGSVNLEMRKYPVHGCETDCGELADDGTPCRETRPWCSYCGSIGVATPAERPVEDAGFWCPQCGPNRPSDDDGCCGTCGADLISQEVIDQIRSARPPAPAEEVVPNWTEDVVLHRALHRSKPGPWEVCNAVYHMSMTNYEHVIATIRRLP